MPKPKKNEKKRKYISRFMSSGEAKKDYPDKDQRLAVAYSMYRRRKSKKKRG